MKNIEKLSKWLVLVWIAFFSVAHAAVPANWWVDIVNDRVDDVQVMLRQGADPNAISPKGQPSIMLAVRNGAWRVYDLLAADPKTKVNITNGHDETPLMYLAVVGQTKRALALIQRGAEVNRLGWTPLHYAASTGKVDTARMLIDHKAIINAPSPDGTTPLMMAAYSGSHAMVQLLLHAGADVTMRNLDKKSAADWASGKNFTDLADELDALDKKTMARREARRARDVANQAQTLPVSDGTAAGASQPAGNEKTPDIAPQARKQSAPADSAASPAVPGAAGNTQENGTSKYFNLENVDPGSGH